MPSFRREGIDSFEMVPTFQQKIDDLRILIQVIENSREGCMRCVNGVVLMGPKSLAQLSREFRALLSFYHEEFHPHKGLLRLGFSIRLKGGADTMRKSTNP